MSGYAKLSALFLKIKEIYFNTMVAEVAAT